MRFHPGLENQRCGHAVDGPTSLFNREFSLPQETVGFGGGPAFVPEMDGHAEVRLQFGGELAHFPGLRSFGTAQPEGQADHDFLHLVVLQQASQGFHRLPFILALDGFETLSRDSKRVRHRNTDSFGADIQGKNPAGRRHEMIIDGSGQASQLNCRGRGSIAEVETTGLVTADENPAVLTLDLRNLPCKSDLSQAE
jgi:hypothetical protein